jgi:predicted site-specific integrase-resolvase
MKAKVLENEYTAANICYWFGLDRSTLFRWEKDGDIPKATRKEASGKSVRTYDKAQVRKISAFLRKELKAEYARAVDNENLEQMSSTDKRIRQHELFADALDKGRSSSLKQHIEGFVSIYKPLSERDEALLIELVKRIPRGTEERKFVWEVLSENESLIGSKRS